MGHVTVTATHAAVAVAKLDQLMKIARGDASAQLLTPPSVGIIMGSDSDLPTMAAAAEVLESFGIGVEVTGTFCFSWPADCLPVTRLTSVPGSNRGVHTNETC